MSTHTTADPGARAHLDRACPVPRRPARRRRGPHDRDDVPGLVPAGGAPVVPRLRHRRAGWRSSPRRGTPVRPNPAGRDGRLPRLPRGAVPRSGARPHARPVRLQTEPRSSASLMRRATSEDAPRQPCGCGCGCGGSRRAPTTTATGMRDQVLIKAVDLERLDPVRDHVCSKLSDDPGEGRRLREARRARRCGSAGGEGVSPTAASSAGERADTGLRVPDGVRRAVLRRAELGAAGMHHHQPRRTARGARRGYTLSEVDPGVAST